MPLHSSKKRILFLTTANLSTNPRLLKEVLFLKEFGYKVKVLAFKLGNWYDSNDAKLIQQHGLKVHYLSAKRKPLLPWLKSSFLHLLKRRTWTTKASLKDTAIASNKRSILLMHALKKYTGKYDYVLAHNLGALFPAYEFAQKHEIQVGFDVEDYHPGEVIEFDAENEKIRRETLMKRILPNLTFVTAAAPMITAEVENLLVEACKITTINNSFFSTEFKLLESEVKVGGEKIQFVWFSQNISYGRGLEEFITAAKRNEEKMILTLVGAVDDLFQKEWIEPNADFIIVKPPMPQNELHTYLSKFDVGLALEMASADFNRSICLTNKLFTYVQAGLFVMATNTPAQQKFLSNHSNLGMLTAQSSQEMSQKINEIRDDLVAIRKNKMTRWSDAKKMAYENEGRKLLNLLNHTK